jgi:TMEM175 potassium channel family protein
MLGEGRRAAPAVERTVMLTDAVVAIAMTLLVLPLVEAVPEVDLNDVGAFVAEHLSLFVSFIVSFLVILLFWGAHHRVFGFLEVLPGTVRWLNALWLLLIAFIPFPTALLGRGPTTSTAPVYIGTVCALAATSAAMTFAGSRSVSPPTVRRYLSQRALVASGAALVALVCVFIAMGAPDLGLFGLAAIAVVRVVGDRWTGNAPAT